MQSSQDHSLDEIEVGFEQSYFYKITDSVHQGMLTIFGDCSPLHVDEAYARSAGFEGCVMHGAIFNGFLSHFIGMYFPGKRAMILSVSMNYHIPSYLGDEFRLTTCVRQKVEWASVIALDFRFENQTSHVIAASGRAQVKIRHG